MAYPVVATTTTGNAEGTSIAITNPTGSTTGNGILVIFGSDDASTASITGGTNWTKIHDTLGGSSIRLTAYWKILDGVGDSLTIGLSGNERCAWTVYRITGAHPVTVAAAQAVADEATSANPNSSSLNPSAWDVEETMWVTGFVHNNGDSTVSSYPSGYTNTLTDARTGVSGVRVGSATKNVTAASEDPPAFTVSTSTEKWLCATFAIRPAKQALSGTIASRVDTTTTGNVAEQLGYASIVSTNKGSSSTTVSSQALPNPTGSTTGNLVIHVIGANNKGIATCNFSVGAGTGWTEVTEIHDSYSDSTIYWKRLTGSGDDLTINLSTAFQVAWYSLRISTGGDTTAPEFAVTAIDSNLTTDSPPSLNPAGWGTEKTLWIAAQVCNDGRYVPTAYPTNYNLHQGYIAGNGGHVDNSTVAVAARKLNAASEDPAYFPWSNTYMDGSAWTIAVRYAHRALSGSLASRYDTTMAGSFDWKITGSLASRFDTTTTGGVGRPLSGTLGSRLDTTTTGNILGWTGKSRFDATFVGEVVTSTTWALSGSGASRIDTTFDGTNLAPLTGSAASRFDTTFVGTNVAWLTGSAASRIDTNLDGTHLLFLTGSGAGRIDTTFDGVVTSLWPLSGSAASRLDTTFTGVFDYKITGSLAGRLDTTFAGTSIRPLAGSAASRIDTTTAGLILKYLTGSIGARVDTTVDGYLIRFLTGTLAGRLDATFTGSLNYIISGTLASRLDTTFTGYKYWPITGSIGSSLDTTFDGQVVSSILISGLISSAGTSTLLGNLVLGDIFISGLVADAVPSSLVAFVTTDEVIAPSPATATPLTPLYGGVRINWQPMLYKKEHDE